MSRQRDMGMEAKEGNRPKAGGVIPRTQWGVGQSEGEIYQGEVSHWFVEAWVED